MRLLLVRLLRVAVFALFAILALADSMVQIALKPWVAVEDYVPVVGELSLAVVETRRRRGISIPYPQRELRLIGAG